MTINRKLFIQHNCYKGDNFAIQGLFYRVIPREKVFVESYGGFLHCSSSVIVSHYNVSNVVKIILSRFVLVSISSDAKT